MNGSNFWIAWAVVLATASLVLWCIAAFLLRGGRQMRVVFSVELPALGVAVFMFADYWAKRIPPAEPGWDIFYAIFSLIAGAFTAIVTIPVWFLAEAVLRRSAR